MRSLAIMASLLAAVPGQEPQARLRPDWGVVLPKEQARAFWKPQLCNRPAPSPIESIWIPDAATIRRVENALAPALQNAIAVSKIADTKPAVSDFYRQYAGFIIAGQRIVYINGFHARTVDRGRPASWRTQALLPCDGGMLFFGAEFRVDTGVVDKIIFNGGGRGRAG
jgi:hypothetical protein